MWHKSLLLFFALLLAGSVRAQIPVEILGGDKKASFDLMFFRFFKEKSGQNSKFLFFSRERAVVDYRQTSTRFLPQFGFTEALSWNHPGLKGIAPVLVGQVLNNGTFGKAGVQYVYLSQTVTVFGWSVMEIKKNPFIDVFLLLRYTPRLNKKWQLYSQIELINTLPTGALGYFSFGQRLRLGVKKGEWQFGAGSDFSAFGRETYSTLQNTGLFLRHEF